MHRSDSPTELADVSAFASHPIYQNIVARHRVVELLGLQQPYFRVFDEHYSGRSWMHGRELVDLSSYNCLGLAEDARARKCLEHFSARAFRYFRWWSRSSCRTISAGYGFSFRQLMANKISMLWLQH